jgi:hypothetical protein
LIHDRPLGRTADGRGGAEAGAQRVARESGGIETCGNSAPLHHLCEDDSMSNILSPKLRIAAPL